MMFGAMSAELVEPSAFMRCVYMQHLLPDRSRGLLYRLDFVSPAVKDAGSRLVEQL